jgi:hypothetical protein
VKIAFITSYYRGERYLRRYLACASRLAGALRAAGHDPVFAVAVNEPRSRERKAWDAASRRLPVEPVYCERETVYASWNRLLRQQAQADVFLIWNMDDWRWAKGALAQARALAEQPGPCVAVSDHQALQLILWPLYFRWHPLRKADLHSPTPFLAFNRAAWEANGPFIEEFRISGDKEWFYRAQKKKIRIALEKAPSGILYHADAGLSTSSDPRRICENLVIQEMYPELNSLHYGYYRGLHDAVVPRIREELSKHV